MLRKTKKRKAYISNRKRANNAQIPPMMIIRDIKALHHELVRGSHRAELAIGRCVRVGHVSTGEGYVWVQVITACHVRGRIDVDQLDGRAFNFLMTQRLTQDAFDEVGVGRDMVHPLPPAESPEGLKDTVAEKSINRQRICQENEWRRGVNETHKFKTNENKSVNKRAAISALGAIAAVACPNPV